MNLLIYFISQFIHYLQPIRIRHVVEFSKIGKTEYRIVIISFALEGLSATEVHTKITSILKEYIPSFQIVHRWAL